MLTLKEIKPDDPNYYKPLDELIEDLGHAEPTPQYGDVIITVEDLTDALHYLKEYKEKCHELDILVLENRRAFEQLGVEITRYQEAVKNCEVAETKYRKLAEETSQNLGKTSQNNPPLTWDELKQMAGKPVWISSPDICYACDLCGGLRDCDFQKAIDLLKKEQEDDGKEHE